MNFIWLIFLMSDEEYNFDDIYNCYLSETEDDNQTEIFIELEDSDKNININYSFPSLPAIEMWRAWIYGIPNDHLEPFHQLSRKQFGESNGASQFTKASKVMEALRKKVGMSWVELSRLEPNVVEKKFHDAFKVLFGGSSNSKCSTLYKRL